ncbi:MAG: hypothetical protein ACPF9D_14635, partial [Owenweeksia sp.]
NELSINADWQDITVVYGILDPSTDTNIIRIERGYLGSEPARNSYDKPDSLYYDEDEIVVTLTWYSITSGGNRGAEVGKRILDADYNIRSLNDNGPFTTEGYRVYPVISPDIPISSDYEYELIIDKTDGGPQVKASTRILESFEYRRPITNINGREFRGTLSWKNTERDIRLYQPRYYFYYDEYDLTTKQKTRKEIMFRYDDVEQRPSNPPTDFEISFTDDNHIFYSNIAGNVEPDPNVLRFFHHMRFEVWGADENLTTYLNLKRPSNSINQNRPEFTNIENGAGIFASRIKVVLDDVTLADDGATISVEEGLYIKEIMCDKRFAYIPPGSGDTCICQ